MYRFNPNERKMAENMLDRVETALADNLMPFWANHAWDDAHGGFLTRLDRRGRLLDDSEKILMMQVRMIFSLAAAHGHGLRDRGYLELAGRGLDYLISTFWDREEGGFHFSVSREGVPHCRRKNTDFHAYTMTGLSMYAKVSGSAEALAWANRIFNLLQEKAADRDLGFLEDFDGADWPALNADQMELGRQTGLKTIDMHTNMLEGMMYLTNLSGDPEHKRALRQMLDLICTKGIHPVHGCTITAFDADWTPVEDGQGRMTTSYGLNVELAWLIWAAAEVLEESGGLYHRIALGLIDHALAFGFDRVNGGLAANGLLTGSVLQATVLGERRLFKSWWAQAELLNALADACDRTGNRRYFEALVKTFDWIWRFQIDHECGDWYQDTQWDTGTPVTTDKGGEFKTAFHAGRALMRTATALKKWLGA